MAEVFQHLYHHVGVPVWEQYVNSHSHFLVTWPALTSLLEVIGVIRPLKAKVNVKFIDLQTYYCLIQSVINIVQAG